MKRIILLSVCNAICAVLCHPASAAPVGTAFSYQGQLKADSVPVNASCDFVFSLWNDATGIDPANQVGSNVAATVQVVSGLFDVTLNFGAGRFLGEARWLQTVVTCPGDAGPTTLTPRQELTPTPYAIRAGTGVGAANALNVTPAGFVGIGTSSPQRTLQVGSTTIRGSEGMIRLASRSGDTNFFNNRSWDIGVPETGGDLTGAGYSFVIDDTARGSADDPPEFMVQVGSGNVGIGTSNPVNKLSLVGNADFSGNVGIGTSVPAAPLHIVGPDNDGTTAALRLQSGSQYMLLGDNEIDTGPDKALYLNLNSTNGVDIARGGGDVQIATAGGDVNMAFGGGVVNIADTGNVNLVRLGGNVYIANAYSKVGIGTSSPAGKLHIYAGGPVPGPGNTLILGNTNASHIRFDVNDIQAMVGGAPSTLWLNHEGGTVSVKTLTIEGGADLSEGFNVSAPEDRVEPGMVVVIDPDNPGKLAISERAYDRKVAGVVSGAGGVKPGMIMGQSGTMADGEHPVALTGRVWAWCDASTGAIEPGDQLTTSPTPGHAMKVTSHERAMGATIGKAMSPLASGKGLVLVLVSLQ